MLIQGCHPARTNPIGSRYLQEEQKRRRKAEYHERVPVEAVAPAAQCRERQILPHRHDFEIAHAAPVEIARSAVVGSVGAPPVIVWRQREDADDAADPIVGAPRPEETRRARNRAGS